MDTQNLQEQINILQRDLIDLTNQYYSNNFSARQDFNKFSNFKTRLKVPSYSVAPTKCEVGEIIEVGGKLKICSAVNTWTTVGTQS